MKMKIYRISNSTGWVIHNSVKKFAKKLGQKVVSKKFYWNDPINHYESYSIIGKKSKLVWDYYLDTAADILNNKKPIIHDKRSHCYKLNLLYLPHENI